MPGPVAITLHLPVEELLEAYPQAAGFLADHQVVCVVCGKPYWGTLGELMAHKGVADPDGLLKQLQDHLQDANTPAS